MHMLTKNYTEAEQSFDQAMRAYPEGRYGKHVRYVAQPHPAALRNDDPGNTAYGHDSTLFEAAGIEDFAVDVAPSCFMRRCCRTKAAWPKPKHTGYDAVAGTLHSLKYDGDYYIALA